jgi:hypothetical protein
MKTIEERAQEFVDTHLLARGMSKDNKTIMKRAIIGLLQEQEKITYFECAEIVLSQVASNKS